MILPDDKSSIFLVCEDIRTEMGNKFSFMGVFVNNDLVFPKGGPTQLVVASLACVFLGKGGDGQMKTRTVITDPSGAIFFETPLATETLGLGASHLMLAKMIGSVMKIGTYTANYTFDNLTITRTFEVKYL